MVAGRLSPAAELGRARWNAETARVMQRARSEARRMNHREIRSEHLLLGLLGDRGILELLVHMGITKLDIRDAIEARVEPGSRLVLDDVALDDEEVRDVVASTLEEVVGFGHKRVRNCHLLLGLIKAEESLAGRVLGSFGASVDGARHEVLEFVAEADARAGRRSPPAQVAN